MFIVGFQVYNSAAQLQFKICYGEAVGNKMMPPLQAPSGVAVSRDNHIYICDKERGGRVIVLEMDGTFVTEFKTRAPHAPTCIGVDNEGLICIGAFGEVHVLGFDLPR